MKKTLVIGAMLALMLAGCFGGGQDSFPQDDEVGTRVAQTLSAKTAVALTVEAVQETNAAEAGTSTIGPGDAIPPEAATQTPEMEEVLVESSTRVNFDPGGTRAAVDGSVGAGQADEYVLGAMVNQILQVNLSPSAGSVFLDIRGADGTNLIPDGSQWAYFWSSLPSTQDYKIKVISAGAAQLYSINIVVPAMIVFGAGESSQTINGHVGENTMVDYLIYAQGGQEMEVTVATPGVQVALSITGMTDGEPYLRYVSDATDWTFTLPITQYYKISVVTIGPATNFTLVVEVN